MFCTGISSINSLYLEIIWNHQEKKIFQGKNELFSFHLYIVVDHFGSICFRDLRWWVPQEWVTQLRIRLYCHYSLLVTLISMNIWSLIFFIFSIFYIAFFNSLTVDSFSGTSANVLATCPQCFMCILCQVWCILNYPTKTSCLGPLTKAVLRDTYITSSIS